MFSITQPSRPTLPSPHPLPPMNQQPSRHSSSSSLPPRPNLASIPTPSYQPPTPRETQPRSQIEAMPPFTSKSIAAAFDPSRRHPVFFTDRLHMAPPGVGTGQSSWMSPVSEGYVFNDGDRRKVEGVVKL